MFTFVYSDWKYSIVRLLTYTNMKKVLSVIIGVSVAVNAAADIAIPSFLSTDFEEDLKENIYPDGWVSSGVDDVPTGEYKSKFKNYSSENAVKLMNYNGFIGMMSPSEFENGSKSDQWLISPEITIDTEDAVLNFTIAAIGNTVNNKYKVYISEGGTAKEDFMEVFGSAVKGDMTKIQTVDQRFVISGYEGTKVRLAFVNEGNTSGMVGFGNIQFGPYYLTIKNPDTYNSLILTGDSKSVGMTIGLTTPVNTNGFTAVLEMSSGFRSEYVSGTRFSSAKFKEDVFTFPGELDFGDSEIADYKITLTPNYSEAPATVITGRIMYAEMLYKRVAFLEEFTGTWCQACPWGYSALNFYNDKFNGIDGNGKVVSVAVHNKDAMAVTEIDKNITSIGKQMGLQGYPTLMVNRTTLIHPADSYPFIKEFVNSMTYAKVKIADVAYDKESGVIDINYDLYTGFTADGTDFSVFAVITQNNMKGIGPEWIQKNALGQGVETKSNVVKLFCEDAWPYFEMFVGKDVPGAVADLPFNDVARQYYPSYTGVEIKGGVVKNEPKRENFSFQVTPLVADDDKAVQNMVVSVVLVDNYGKIITADNLEADKFSFSGVETVNSDKVIVSSSESAIMIDTPCAGVADIYSADGMAICSSALKEGINRIEVSSGLRLVKISTPEGNTSSKIIVK